VSSHRAASGTRILEALVGSYASRRHLVEPNGILVAGSGSAMPQTAFDPEHSLTRRKARVRPSGGPRTKAGVWRTAAPPLCSSGPPARARCRSCSIPPTSAHSSIRMAKRKRGRGGQLPSPRRRSRARRSTRSLCVSAVVRACDRADQCG
jgi:hypothetical protein